MSLKRAHVSSAMLVLVVLIGVGLSNPASAGVLIASKATPKPTSSKTSACYKAILAKTAFASVQQDADNVISVVNSLTTLIPSLKASYSGVTTIYDFQNALSLNSTIYAKASTYTNALSIGMKLLDNSSSKALKNVVSIKIASGGALDTLASLNAFKSIFRNDFPFDPAGILITRRNIQETTNTLVNATDSTYSGLYPSFATHEFTQAANILASDLGGFDYAKFTTSIVDYLRSENFTNAADPDSLATLDSYVDNNVWGNATFKDPWGALQARPDYALSELKSIATFTQEAKISASAALLKLPKC